MWHGVAQIGSAAKWWSHGHCPESASGYLNLSLCPSVCPAEEAVFPDTKAWLVGQSFASGLSAGSRVWKEDRTLWASFTKRWPKALLYHSWDLPLRSTLHMCVSLVRPDPLGSRRYWDSSTTPLTVPVRGLSSWSTDAHTRAHEPLHSSVRQDRSTT